MAQARKRAATKPAQAVESDGLPAKRTRRKKGVAPSSRGLSADDLVTETLDANLEALTDAIHNDGGSVLSVYRDPLGGHPVLLAGLPVERVEPTPFQRNLSETHAKRLASVLEKVDVFLDPIIAVRRPNGHYWTPNGLHRLEAMKRLGGRALVALVLPDEHVAFQILALNTEKAHNLHEKSVEVIRMAQALVDAGTDRTERDFAFEFEEPALVTLGICYESHPRFSGSQYLGILRATCDFLDRPLHEALDVRRAHATRLVELDDRITEVVSALKARGFVSPYLKSFVVARCNPLRFRRGATLAFDDVVARMLDAAAEFDVEHVRPDQIARTAGPPLEEAA